MLHGGPWERWIEHANRNWTRVHGRATGVLSGLLAMTDDETWRTQGI